MKILVLSNTPWNKNNSFGNSYSNIFAGIPDLIFANIYCRYGEVDEQFISRGFQITEKSLLQNLRDANEPSGYQTFSNNKNNDKVEVEPIPGFVQGQKRRWQIMYWTRDFIWKIGRWKSIQLKTFIDDFKPDLIFQPIYYSSYINEISLFIKEYTNVPMIGYISDDNYTLHQYNFSPLYWIDRLYKRRKVKAVIDQCELLYVISDIQKREYEKIFTTPCKILTKCADFSTPPLQYNLPQKPIRMIYAGNIGSDRWKSLAIIANAVEELNKKGKVYTYTLEIYTLTPLTNKMLQGLKRRGCYIKKSVSYDEIVRLQQEADIMVHVEGLSKKARMTVHQSFSTKLVDFFKMGKCIFAVGTPDEASIKHLLDNDAGVVASNQKEVYEKLLLLANNPEMILEYGRKAYACGAKYHNKDKMQKMLIEDMKRVVAQNSKNRKGKKSI